MAERASHTDIKIVSANADVDEVAKTKAEIERTRAHMEKTLDTIGERLAPERFKAEAVDAVGKIKHEAIDTAEHLKDAAVEAARAATHEVIHGVKSATREVVDNARSKVRHTKHQIKGAGMSFVDTLKENPIPTAMVGIGLYWLYSSLQEDRYQEKRVLYGARRHPYYEVDDVDVDVNVDLHGIKDKAGAYAGEAREKVRDVKDQVSSKALELTESARELSQSAKERAAELRLRASEKLDRYNEKLHHYGDVLSERKDRALQTISHTKHQAVDKFQYMLDTNPLGVAGLAGLMGLVFGLLLPETEVENRTMGYKREELVAEAQDKIKETASELKEKAKQVATSTVETVKEEAKAQGLVPEMGSEGQNAGDKTIVGDVEAKIQIDL